MKEDPRRNEVEDFQNAKPSQLSYGLCVTTYNWKMRELRRNGKPKSRRDRFLMKRLKTHQDSFLSSALKSKASEPRKWAIANQRPRLSVHDSDEDILPSSGDFWWSLGMLWVQSPTSGLDGICRLLQGVSLAKFQHGSQWISNTCHIFII